nr:DUF4450 domain-containing protein [uncultured Acetatifactor sp.]
MCESYFRCGKFEYIYYLGDRPKMVLSDADSGQTADNDAIDGYLNRYAHFFMGILNGADSRWMDEMEEITSRYVYGREEYEIRDSSFEGEIRLVYCRSNRLDAMLVKVVLPGSLTDKLVVAAAGQNGKKGAQPVGGCSDALCFVAEDTKGTTIYAEDTHFLIADNKTAVAGTASIPLYYSVKDACRYREGLLSLYAAGHTEYPMAVGISAGNERQELYLLFTTEPTTQQHFRAFGGEAGELFEEAVDYWQSLAETVRVNTPDACLNAAVAAQTVAMDASWNAPTIRHGPIGWHVPFAGWRSSYGYVVAGWAQRIRENMHQYIRNQQSTGRVTAYSAGDSRYNMGEVLVDQLLYYWLWSGDTAFFKEEAYDFVKGHLRFQEETMRVPGTQLYENFLNAWNTDNKWNNGGPGSIASAYTWRAYKVMAQIAQALEKEEDSRCFQEKADRIREEMEDSLWDGDRGVYGEYRDIFGLKRLHTAPDLSSIYTPIDVGLTEYQQSCQMLWYADSAIEWIETQETAFPYSSNWKPLFYSSMGLYAQEALNLALAYFRAGQREKGYKICRACLLPLYRGKGAGPGACSHTLDGHLENTGHIDFAETSSLYIRTVVEGVFGILLQKSRGEAQIHPGVPEEWKQAEIAIDDIGYQFRQEGKKDIFLVKTRDALKYMMQVPARSSVVEGVWVNGVKVPYSLSRTVMFETMPLKEARIEIQYGDSAPAGIQGAGTAVAGGEYCLRADGLITKIMDPQGILEEMPELPACAVSVRMRRITGYHTFFAEVEKDEMKAVLPVNLELKGTEEISGMGAEERQAQTLEGTEYQTVPLDGYVNQNLRELHNRFYDLTWNGDRHYVLPNFYFCRDTTRTVTVTGRSWWEDLSRGKNGVPDRLNLPVDGGVYRTDAGIPFLIAAKGEERQNAVFVSLYNQFPDEVSIPVNRRGSRIYFMLAVSTNSMQSRIENARITVCFADGEERELPLVNPDNIDDWLCYQGNRTNDWDSFEKAESWAETGEIQPLGDKAHANILSVGWGRKKEIAAVRLQCMSNEVLVGILGITVS